MAPGEIALTHRGILFLDESPECGTHVLEVMRQPMEDKVVIISRARDSLAAGYMGSVIAFCLADQVLR